MTDAVFWEFMHKQAKEFGEARDIELQELRGNWTKEMVRTALWLARSGCECDLPLLGNHWDDSSKQWLPRCRLCNTKVYE